MRKTRDRLYFLYDEMITIGIDEAGRGPLAGPVWVGAAVILDQDIDLTSFGDSKTLTKKRRNIAYDLIQYYVREGKLLIASSYSRASTIDRLGIIRAQAQAMRICIKKIITSKSGDAVILVDGNHVFGLDRTYDTQTIIGGDGIIPEISIASIVAKVERDRYMTRQAQQFSQYGFDQHKGYGTKHHREMIAQHGLSRIHRRSFCRNFISM